MPSPDTSPRKAGFNDASMYNRILVATDLSDCADAALRASVDLVCQHGGEIHLCTALGSPREPMVLGSSTMVQRELEEEAKEAEVRLHQKVVGNGLTNIRHHLHVLRHLPGDEVPRAALRLGCDLIVICSRGGSGPRRFALGSVAERILANARIPVLVVPPATRH
jgi:nucleotide-binding universal stress UspA family protein